MCPFLGTKTISQQIAWPGHDAFNHAARDGVVYPALKDAKGKVYGEYVKLSYSEDRTLMYAKIYGAGHMVNEKRGVEAKGMFYRWIFGHNDFWRRGESGGWEFFLES